MRRWMLPWLATSLLVAQDVPHAQSFPEDPFNQEIELPREPRAQPPMLRFELVAEILLPGPLPEASPRQDGGTIALPVEGGIAFSPVDGGGEPSIREEASGDTSEQPGAAALSADGARRYRVDDRGRVIAERRCKRCSSGWKKDWRLKTAGNPLTTPLVAARRLYFGGMDNRVYCVKAANGHRVWVTDVGARVSRRLVLWQGRDTAVILTVPEDGQQMIALDGETGVPVADVRLAPGDGRLVGVPLALADGRIAVSHQKYEPKDARLEIYALSGSEASPAPESDEAGPEATARTTSSAWPEWTSVPSAQRSSTTSATAGSPGPP